MQTLCRWVGALCPYGDLAGRVGLAAIFLYGGVGKLGGYLAGSLGTQGYMEIHGVPGALLPAVIALEIIGGVALIIGWQTRWCALALAGFTALAALLFHADFDHDMQQILFLKNAAIAGGLLVLCRAGAGPFSLDHRRQKNRAPGSSPCA